MNKIIEDLKAIVEGRPWLIRDDLRKYIKLLEEKRDAAIRKELYDTARDTDSNKGRAATATHPREVQGLADSLQDGSIKRSGIPQEEQSSILNGEH